MKRIVCLVLVMAMLLTLCACGNEKVDLYCSACGTGLAKDAAFCNSCGTQVSGAPAKEEGTDGQGSATTSATATTEAKVTTAKPTTTTKPKATTVRPTTTQKAHTHSYTKKATPATCTEKGYTTYTCSCGHSYKDNYVAAAHKYKDYVCTACGAVDKSHAYEYLVMWVKKNGEVNGSDVRCSYENGQETASVGYNAKYDYVYLSSGGYYGEKFYFGWVALDTYDYSVEYGEQELNGVLNVDEYSKNSPIPYEGYSGDSNDKYRYIEFSRECLIELMDFLVWFLREENIGITVADLGFKAYQ